MTPFVEHMGIVAPLLTDNIDTDQIIPSREMNRISKVGLGGGLFAGWRYEYDGLRKVGLLKDFVLNDPAYDGCSILLSGKNFGCGSSREHAVWALRDYGIRAIIAESFGRIFRNNCAKNGLLAIELPAATIQQLHQQTRTAPDEHRLRISLAQCTIQTPDGTLIPFEVAEMDRELLLEGLDHIEYTLKYSDDIDAWAERQATNQPWSRISAVR